MLFSMGLVIVSLDTLLHVRTQKRRDILKSILEGTSVVKVSKLQKLTKYFKNLTMNDDETFEDFYGKLNE